MYMYVCSTCKCEGVYTCIHIRYILIIESLGGPSLLFTVKSNKKYLRLIQKYITKGLLLCVVVLWLRCWSSVMVSLCEL